MHALPAAGPHASIQASSVIVVGSAPFQWEWEQWAMLLVHSITTYGELVGENEGAEVHLVVVYTQVTPTSLYAHG